MKRGRRRRKNGGIKRGEEGVAKERLGDLLGGGREEERRRRRGRRREGREEEMRQG